MNSFQPAKILICVLVATILYTPISLAFNAEETGDSRNEWRFKVYLDDKDIGSHTYQFSTVGDLRRMHTVADFRVRFLFVTAYRYRHVNTEIWNNGCLQRIDAWTDDNGKEIEVSGFREADAFEIDVDGSGESMPKCVRSFAYWNKAFLDNPALLNAQTGKLLPVQVERLPDEEIVIGGMGQNCERYRLLSTDIDIEIWYGSNDEWLGLTSTTKSGKRIRYELS